MKIYDIYEVQSRTGNYVYLLMVSNKERTGDLRNIGVAINEECPPMIVLSKVDRLIGIDELEMSNAELINSFKPSTIMDENYDYFKNFVEEYVRG